MAPERRRSALTRLTFITAALVAAAAVAPGLAFPFPADPASRPDPQRSTPTTQSPPPSPALSPSPPPPDAGHAPPGIAAHQPAFGAYLHYGPPGLKRMKQLTRWLGGHEVRVGHTYLPGDLWNNIEGAHGFLNSWAEWRRAQDDRLFVLNVPLMERNEENVPDREVGQLLRRAAAGEFDDHFRVLAERLVELGVPDTVLVLGWEMNGITYTHRCDPDPERWKRYWRRIVTVMRSVPGQKFKFDFAPSRGTDAIPWPKCYPGDDYVDIVGMDSYDQPHDMTFDEQVTEPYGLKYHVDFAREHDKPISYPEWGLFRNGDNVTYMLRMLAWMDEHKPFYNTITDYCPHGVWLCSANPRASALYRAVLSNPPEPKPTPIPAPTDPTKPNPTPPLTPTPTPPPPPMPSKLPHCTPLDLSGWLEQQIGGKLTVCLQWAERYS
ncbi:glycosyl hydrolase [Streptomyces sp. NPDC051954]|uniref:glycoside hydrolase family 26 protein n=1 Tax=Streptomyces sp. NPDC051954 TaxID=3155524 RepID=UPI003418673A